MKTLFSLIARLPWCVLFALSDFFYVIVYYIARYRRKVVRKNLVNSFPEKDLKSIIKLEKKFYHHFCDLFVETIKLFHISVPEVQKHFKFTNIDEIKASLAAGDRLFMFSAHHASWEYLISLSIYFDFPFIHFYKQLTNKTFDAMMLEMREQFGSISIETNNGMRELAKREKEGGAYITGFIVDQAPLPQSRQYWTRFLNQDTPFIFTAERMARKFSYKACYSRVVKVKRGYYEVTILPMCDNVANTAQNEITQMYAEMLEADIRNQPECYLWSHNRWKYSRKDYEKSSSNNS
ncbi:MAG: lysophospholipid acyltransferase family protein [Paludibacteraceae bacterium]|nr:lysophospholipid acyltransferase family protein [Paludibacteraceae bacterium]